MELGQPRLAVQHLGGHAQALEVVENVGLDALQPGLGGLETVRLDAEGQILGLDKTIVAPCQLVLQHGGILRPNAVKIIALEGDVDGAGEGFLGGHEVQKRQLELNRAVEVVEKITPALKNRGLVLVLRELVVDVLELDGFRVAAIRHLTDAVRPHPLIGDAVLGRFFLFIRAVGAGNGRFNLFPVGTGQFLLWNRRLLAILIGLPVFLSGEQCHTPPCRVLPAVPARHRSYWS